MKSKRHFCRASLAAGTALRKYLFSSHVKKFWQRNVVVLNLRFSILLKPALALYCLHESYDFLRLFCSLTKATLHFKK